MVDLVEGLLVKYSVQRGVSVHQDGDIVKRQMESHFPRTIPPTEKKWKQDSVLTAASTIKETVYYCQHCDSALCNNRCFQADHTRIEY
jgi:hypothetical protein